jgi:phenylalanyl-tRNA synthetase alpha chain
MVGQPGRNPSVLEEINQLKQLAQERVRAATSIDELEAVRLTFLGKKGEVTRVLRNLGTLEPELRKVVGAAVNELKEQLTSALESRRVVLLDNASSVSEPIDVTLPGTGVGQGGLHPTIQMMYDLNDAFTSLNFEIFEGPEITSELYEFDNLNFPPDHPARESMDTYWVAGGDNKRGAQRPCLRPHLTGASVRYMQRNRPPFRFVYPGRVYRNEATDARHERAFFQYEALIVEQNFPFTSGQLLIDTVLDTVFGRSVRTRMRAGFFPFVEPGFEIDMECLVCGGSGCKVCKQVGWLEVMPGGVPHPNVLRAGGIDPEQWMGFYINVGLDRLVMMRYGIDDVRLFHGGDLRFLGQFK